MIGPMEEGDDVILSCRVIGGTVPVLNPFFVILNEFFIVKINIGRPSPDVSWFMNDKLVDEEYEQSSGNIIENRLLWPSLERKDLHAKFTCRASNTKAIAPRDRQLMIDMYRK